MFKGFGLASVLNASCTVQSGFGNVIYGDVKAQQRGVSHGMCRVRCA